MTELESKLKEDLNDQQFEAAMHMQGPLVIMAGAGSGKTHTLMSRVAHLVDSGVNPKRILMLTFTNAAADEMKNRSVNLLDSRCADIIACTYHKFCNIMLRRYGRVINLDNYSIISASENKNLINYVKSSNEIYDLTGFPPAKTLMNIFSKKINCDKTIKEILLEDDFNKYIKYVDEIDQLFDDVKEYSYNNRKLNYDDLLVYMNQLLDNENICHRIADSFDYIMIDEFQDTNNLQEEIIIKLSKFNDNVAVVGDISQSIYAFRGANVRNLQNFHSKFSNCKVVVLYKNYRSTQEILDLANKVMNTNVNSWSYFDMESNNKYGSKPLLTKAYDDFNEKDKVIELIQEYHNQGINYSDIAILERGSMSSFGIEAELNKLNIPFEKRGGMKFMDYECIGDMLAYFAVITDPYNLLCWFRLLQLHPGIGNSNAKKIADLCINKDFLLSDTYKKRKYYPELEMLNARYNQFKKEKDLHLLFKQIEDFYFDLRKRTVQDSKMSTDAKAEAMEYIDRDKTIVEQLKIIASKYNDIVSFVDDLLLDSLTQDKKEEDSLIISTVHSAKGLEWKVVIILDCVEGSFPTYIDEFDFGTEKDEEELRCFYVALTRAKDKLHIFAPQFKMQKGIFERTRLTHYLWKSLDYIA